MPEVKIHLSLLIGFILISIYFPLYSQSEWKLKSSKSGIEIYSLKSDSDRFNQVRIDAVFMAKSEQLVAILKQIDQHYKWAYGTETSYLIKTIDDNELIFYKEIKAPGPVANRDLVLHMKVIREPWSSQTKVISDAIRGYVPEKKDVIRVFRSHEVWIITQLNDQSLKVSYNLKLDPGGDLPALFVNLFSSKGPQESFEKLKELLALRN